MGENTVFDYYYGDESNQFSFYCIPRKLVTGGRVFIYYTLDEIQEDLNCGHDKATKLLVELDCGKSAPSYIESNQTDLIQPDPSIHP